MALLLSSLYLASCNSISEQTPVQQTTTNVTTVMPTAQDPANNDKFALLLPTTGQLKQSSAAIQNGFMAAYYHQEQQQPNNQAIQVYNTQGKSLNDVYQQAINNGATNVVGPLAKPEVSALNHIKINKPTLALNFSPNGTDKNTLYQFALSPEDEANQVAIKAAQDGKTQALIIAPDSSWGQAIATTFTNKWRNQGGGVVDELKYADKTNFEKSVKQLLHINDQSIKALRANKAPTQPVRRQDFDMIFLIASPDTAKKIVPMLNFYYANDIPIYATSMVYTGIPNPANDKDLDGVKFCDIPLILDNSQQMKTIRNHMYKLIRPSQRDMIRLYAFGIDAYQLSVHQDQFSNNFMMAGMTGNLYLGKQHQILRQLQWAEFKNGTPVNIT